MTFDEHPERYPQQVWRGIGGGINELTNHVLVILDLGFELNLTLIGCLDNISLPTAGSEIPAEEHAARAMHDRLTWLIHDKPLLVLARPSLSLKPTPPLYLLSLFYYQPDRDKTWHSVEDQLVREGHAAWLDASLPVPSIS